MMNRRALLTATAAAGVGLAVGAAPLGGGRAVAAAPVTVLRLERRSLEVEGKAASVFAIRQPDGTPGLSTDLSKAFRVRVDNHSGEPSLIHWHGLTPPWQQDGVPVVSAPLIADGGAADYDFPLRLPGTYWMHSHEGFQEQQLMSAPLIIRGGGAAAVGQEVVVLLHDFSFTPPAEIYATLQKKPMASMTSMSGADTTPDLNDVAYDAFLANDRTLNDPDIVKVEAGAEVLLRIINGSAMSNFEIDLGALEGRLVAVDGMPIVPITGRRFPIAVAQRLDLTVTLPQPGAFPVLAVLEGERKQTGIILTAGAARVARVSNLAERPAAVLGFALEGTLRAASPLPERPADRTHTVDLTGSMQGYVWSLNGRVYEADTPPLEVVKGERVELVLVNRTPMSHPMHLHGHPLQVVAFNGQRFAGAVRDTVLVPPKSAVTIGFDADNPGTWAFHCHLLYHLEAGMFTTVRYVA
jgi:FtsP/CotA-like multicopper oxidase with cupredoxin domain